ncbi:hypothetical protein AB1Y20_004475 [Prymnesium parvum]|uniref:Uncharacterized protein n=1 Tax=Prymnesium parvum TaxID=97485 RepID=A0AB34IWY7_PRYPA
MSAGKVGGALVGMAGLAFVAMQFSGLNADEKKEPVQGSRLKKTLSNAGLYPEPVAGGKLKTRPSGDMAMFTQGGSVADTVLAKEGGKCL